MSQLKNALRTARLLMQKKASLQTINQTITNQYPTLIGQNRKTLDQRIASEYQVLGHVVHDPNLYRDCETARTAKQNLNSPMMLAVIETPMCNTCSFRKAGNCGLMGGQIIRSSNDITEKQVQRLASIVKRENNNISKENLMSIRTASEKPVKRVQKLVAAVMNTDHPIDVTAIQRGRVLAGIMGEGNNLDDVMNQKPRKAKAKRDDAADGYIEVIDRKAALESYNESKTINTPNLQINARDPRRNAKVQITSQPETNLEFLKGTSGKKTASAEQRVAAVQGQMNELFSKVKSAFASGRMTDSRAATANRRIESMKLLGARVASNHKGLYRQIRTLLGDLDI